MAMRSSSRWHWGRLGAGFRTIIEEDVLAGLRTTAKSATTSVSWDGAQHALPSGTANPMRTVSSGYAWNADRTLSTETVQAGVALQQRVTAYTFLFSSGEH